MKNKIMKRKKAAAGLLAVLLLCIQSFGQTFPVLGGMEVTEPSEEENHLSMKEEVYEVENGGDFAQNLDPEDHLNLWVLDEILSSPPVFEEEESSEEENSEEENDFQTEESTEAEDNSDSIENIEPQDSSKPEEGEESEESDGPEASTGVAESNRTEESAQSEESEPEDSTVPIVNFESEEESGDAEKNDMEEKESPAISSEDSAVMKIEEYSETEKIPDLDKSQAIEKIEESEDFSAAKGDAEPEEESLLASSMPTPVSFGVFVQSSEATGHDPEADQKLVLTRIFSYWKKDLWLSPLYRDEAHVSSGGMTSTTLALHRLGNLSDGYPYLDHYIWAYCIEPNVGSNSWTQYQSTAKDAVQLMLKIEQEAPSVYYGMIRTIAYAEYKAAKVSDNEAAAYRCACQTAVWQLLCGMVDGSSGRRITKNEEGYVVDQLYDNIQSGNLALYDNYRENNIAWFTGKQVQEKLDEIYSYLGEYEKIPSFMSGSGAEAEDKTVTMSYRNGQYVAEVEDEQGVLSQFLGTRGTLADSSIRYERKDNKVTFTSDQIPEKTLKVNKTSQPASRTPAYFVYGSYSGSDRKQSLLGECNPDQISAYIRFAPAGKQTGIIKIAEETLCAEGIRNNPNYNMEGAVFGIYDEKNVLREKITLTTDISQVWNSNENSGISAVLRKALKEAGSSGETMNNLAYGVSSGTYEVGEVLILKELVVPKGFQKAPNQRLKVSEVDEKNVWTVAEEPMLDPLDLHFYKKGPEGVKIPSVYLDNAEFTVRFYPEEAGPTAEKPLGECTWSGVFVTSEGGQLLLYKEYCVSGLDSFVGMVNPMTGDLIFPYGWIEILETKAPEGFLLNSNSIWIRLGEDQTQTRIPEQELIRETSDGIDFINQEGIWGTIQGMKTDGKGPLSGAEMMICTEDGQPLASNGRGDDDFACVVKTEEDGSFAWEGLSFGKYLIKEIKAPDGYEISEESQAGFLVEITPDQIEEGELIVVLDPIINQAKTVIIRIVKTMETNEDYCSFESVPWEAIRFRITGVTESGDAVERIVTTDNVEKVENEEDLEENQRIFLVGELPRGTYTISEMVDESLSAYETPEDQIADFLSDEELTLEKTVCFDNRFRRYALRILKRSADTGENLEGSMFRLEVKDYKMDWEENQDNQTEWMEDEKGIFQWKTIGEKLCSEAFEGVCFENLLAGEYRIFETRSPYPYQLLIQNVPLHLPFPGETEPEITLVLQDRAILHPVESGGTGGYSSGFYWMGLILIGVSFLLQRWIKRINER